MSLVENTKQWLNSIPLATRFYFLVCVFIFLLESIDMIYLNNVCASPSYIYNLQYNKFYTMITSAFAHSGLLHILFNMMSFIPQSSSLESTKFGTLLCFYLVFLFSILISLMSFFMSFIISYPPFNVTYSLYNCGVGLSGVIFALLEIQCYGNIHSTNIFAQIRIPLKFYPWFALLFAQIMFPNVSFIGHLSGIVIGFMYVIGLLDPLIPSNQSLIKFELSSFMEYIVSINGYITNPNYGSASSLYNTTTTSASNTSGSISNVVNSWYDKLRSPSSSASNNFTGQGRMLGNSLSNNTNNVVPQSIPYSQSIDMSIERPPYAGSLLANPTFAAIPENTSIKNNNNNSNSNNNNPPQSSTKNNDKSNIDIDS